MREIPTKLKKKCPELVGDTPSTPAKAEWYEFQALAFLKVANTATDHTEALFLASQAQVHATLSLAATIEAKAS